MTLKKRIQSIEKKTISDDSRPGIIEFGYPGPDGEFVVCGRHIRNPETGKYDYEEVSNDT